MIGDNELNEGTAIVKDMVSGKITVLYVKITTAL